MGFNTKKQLSSVLGKKKVSAVNAEALAKVFKDNEAQANKMSAIAILLLIAILAIIVVVVGAVDMYSHYESTASSADFAQTALSCGLSAVPLIAAYVLYRVFNGRAGWLKYVLVLTYVAVCAFLFSQFGYSVTMIMVLPLVLTCRYYSERFTVLIAVITAVTFALTALITSLTGSALVDLNYVAVGSLSDIALDEYGYINAQPADYAAYAGVYMLSSFFISHMTFFILAAVGCLFVAKRGREMVLEQAEESESRAQVASELGLATKIQADMLPQIFPAFPEHEEFDIYATMNPAKEVGGDFYDFFLVDDDHVAVVMADVSGKGVPAALFMVIAKTLIKDHAQLGLSTEETFSKVNNLLCESDDAGLFVTAWLGILDIRTGVMECVEAGHEQPVIMHAGGDFEIVQTAKNFVLAGFEGIDYQGFQLQLEPGDRLFLYTDGIPEAKSDKGEFLGLDRMLAFLNEHKEQSSKEILDGMYQHIMVFDGEADPFDDVTMLMLDYKQHRA